MFYEPDKDDHGLRYNPYKSIVVPRPIGWISTISTEGIANLAPYSQFNNLAYDPPYVMFSAASFPETGRRKDSAKNAADTGEFVVNMATYELRKAVNITSRFVPPEVDEAALAGLEMIPSRLVKPPRVKASPVHLECNFTRRWHCRRVCAIRSIISLSVESSACTFATMSSRPRESSTSPKSGRPPGSAISTTPTWTRSSRCGRTGRSATIARLGWKGGRCVRKR
jgi:flavin reductase (DIM6/NTAB) family NADH-FMN oxidoreductase RutF